MNCNILHPIHFTLPQHFQPYLYIYTSLGCVLNLSKQARHFLVVSVLNRTWTSHVKQNSHESSQHLVRTSCNMYFVVTALIKKGFPQFLHCDRKRWVESKILRFPRPFIIDAVLLEWFSKPLSGIEQCLLMSLLEQ